MTILSEPKPLVAPCSVCKTPEGPTKKFGTIPKRSSGLLVGVNGEVCITCYNRLYKRSYRKTVKSIKKKDTFSNETDIVMKPKGRRKLEVGEPNKDDDSKYEELNSIKKSQISDLSPEEACRMILELWKSGEAWRLTVDIDIDDYE